MYFYIEDVITFCDIHQVEVTDMKAPYFMGNGRHKKQDEDMEHNYRIYVFYSTIDLQLSELNRRFNVEAMELLILSSALDPKENFKSFGNEKICKLVEKFYADDFFELEKRNLSFQLRHYHSNISRDPNLGKISSFSEFYHKLVETGKTAIFLLVDRLIRLVLTFPVSRASTERSFHAMKVIKTSALQQN
ncbi:uncharacterized protein LOC130739690 [Lotus japonicus]|uniref:uncharacterized protein LOC130739690 n=1 Tax=Lotus japonicus TaxID=34305 RepID=UPI00258F7C15|nr:uncharacterized protein LOC130739690 [Lotus japonicus]